MTRRQCLLTLLIVIAAPGCGRHPDAAKFKSTDVTGAPYAQRFALPDHNGQPRTLADFKGKVVVLFFGYTQCPDVCPRTLSKMVKVIQLLGGEARRVQVLFMTVDPERDTAQILQDYVTAFNPTFLGLRGDSATTQATAKELKVYYDKVPGSTPDTYSVDHYILTYVYDPAGRFRLVADYDTSPEDLAGDIKSLLHGK